MARFEIRLKEGDPAPNFQARTDAGREISLSDYSGLKNVVLYFYPKDDTPGCSKEACSFRDDYKKFIQKETVILGVSVDSADSHTYFKQRFNIPFPLLVDPDQYICRTYGVLSDKGYANRVTFLIGKDGIIRKIYSPVDVDRHSQEILNELT